MKQINSRKQPIRRQRITIQQALYIFKLYNYGKTKTSVSILRPGTGSNNFSNLSNRPDQWRRLLIGYLTLSSRLRHRMKSNYTTRRMITGAISTIRSKNNSNPWQMSGVFLSIHTVSHSFPTLKHHVTNWKSAFHIIPTFHTKRDI